MYAAAVVAAAGGRVAAAGEANTEEAEAEADAEAEPEVAAAEETEELEEAFVCCKRMSSSLNATSEAVARSYTTTNNKGHRMQCTCMHDVR